MVNQMESLHQQFSEIINQQGVVLANFSAGWSSPCKIQVSIADQLSKEYDQLIQIKNIEVDEFRELATTFQITSIPTLILFQDGLEMDRFVGLQNAEVLSRAIDNLLR